MPKSVSAIKDILKREEKVLEKLQAALSLMAHKDAVATVKAAIKNKMADIKAYKGILKKSEKCPAVKKAPAKKTAAATARCGTKKC